MSRLSHHDRLTVFLSAWDYVLDYEMGWILCRCSSVDALLTLRIKRDTYVARSAEHRPYMQTVIQQCILGRKVCRAAHKAVFVRYWGTNENTFEATKKVALSWCDRATDYFANQLAAMQNSPSYASAALQETKIRLGMAKRNCLQLRRCVQVCRRPHVAPNAEWVGVHACVPSLPFNFAWSGAQRSLRIAKCFDVHDSSARDARPSKHLCGFMLRDGVGDLVTLADHDQNSPSASSDYEEPTCCDLSYCSQCASRRVAEACHDSVLRSSWLDGVATLAGTVASDYRSPTQEVFTMQAKLLRSQTQQDASLTWSPTDRCWAQYERRGRLTAIVGDLDLILLDAMRHLMLLGPESKTLLRVACEYLKNNAKVFLYADYSCEIKIHDAEAASAVDDFNMYVPALAVNFVCTTAR